jgi:DNA-binding response OmpR family regulator
MPESKGRILVVDDEVNIRQLLEIGLSDDGYIVRAVPDGQAALHVVRDWEPDLVILDVMMPKIDGFELLPMLRRLTEAPVLMLSARGEVADRITGLRGGADDYVAKPFELGELTARIEAALRRPRLAQPSVLRFADLEVDLETRSAQRGDRKLELSAREFDLLAALIRQPRRVFTRDELLDLVWGRDRFVTTGTVETYISYLRAKIDREIGPPLIHTLRGAGYSLREGA